MKNIIIFGASGHGSVVLDIIESEGQFQPVGFIDSYKRKGIVIHGYEIIGNEYDLPFLIEKLNIYGGIVAIGDNWSRKIMVNRILKIVPRFHFINAIHPAAVIGKNVQIGQGTVIVPGTIVNANAQIGDHCILNTSSSLGHDSILSDFSSLAPRVCTGGALNLGVCSAISMGASVIENITIGKHSVVGAGALVLNDVPDYVVAFGSPAKVMRQRRIDDPYLAGPNKDKRIKLMSRTL